MKNTLENKEAFFVQYWSQNVLRNKESGALADNEPSNWNEMFEQERLELKPLSNISNEDYKIAQSLDYNFGLSGLNFSIQRINHSNIDFLRSKGYALPFRGIDVETLVKWGWVKLVKHPKILK